MTGPRLLDVTPTPLQTTAESGQTKRYEISISNTGNDIPKYSVEYSPVGAIIAGWQQFLA